MIWKDGLSKKLHWNMVFLVLSGKMIFLFPENMILLFRLKRKVDLSQTNTWKYDVFFKCSEKMVFPKKSRLNMIVFVISGKMVILFSRIYNISSLDGKWKMIFSVYMYKCYKYDITLQPKSKRDLVPKKYT